jgi:hypothetical protein
MLSTLRPTDSVEISLCIDYPADTRKSLPDQEMWPSDFFAPRGGVCARLAREISGGATPLSAVLPAEIGLEGINF